MKLKKIASIFLTLLFSISAFGQSEWSGEYTFDEDGGATVGGSKILIAHTLKITSLDDKLSAHIYSQGFQTSSNIYANAVASGDELSLFFDRKGEDDNSRQFDKGELLLKLVRKDGKILTNWASFQPVLGNNESNGVERFRSASEDSGWVRQTIPRSDVSFGLPFGQEDFLMTEPFFITIGNFSKMIEVFDTRIHAGSEDGTFLRMESYQLQNKKDLKPVLEKYITKKSFRNKPKSSKLSIGKVSIKKLTKTTNSYHRESWYFQHGDRFYALSAYNADGDRTIMNRFFNSIEIGGKKGEQYKEPIDVTREKFALPDSRLSIVNKATPTYSKLARQTGTTGALKLRVNFRKSGLASVIESVQTQPNGLDLQVRMTSVQMLYLPQAEYGEYVDARKLIAFSFNIY